MCSLFIKYLFGQLQKCSVEVTRSVGEEVRKQLFISGTLKHPLSLSVINEKNICADNKFINTYCFDLSHCTALLYYYYCCLLSSKVDWAEVCCSCTSAFLLPFSLPHIVDVVHLNCELSAEYTVLAVATHIHTPVCL